MTDLIVHPESEALHREMEQLRSELAHALCELEILQKDTGPYLLAIYQQKIGAAELECLNAQCRAEWLRRYAEHVQAAMNRGEIVSTAEIEADLRRELADYWTKLREAATKVADAQHFMSHLMTPEDTAEIRRVYRQIVKRLHPDANPDQGHRERLLWRRTQMAYAEGNLEELKAIWAALQELSSADCVSSGGLTVMEERKQKLMDQLRTVCEQLETLERQPPFDLRAKLQDEGWVQNRRAEIEEQRQQWLAKAARLETHLSILLGGSPDGFIFGFSTN